MPYCQKHEIELDYARTKKKFDNWLLMNLNYPAWRKNRFGAAVSGKLNSIIEANFQHCYDQWETVATGALQNFPLKSVGSLRRPRSEKKPIPDEQKDDKYYERRKRNNQAAKKSRDARRMREDHIALRASMLEHENAVLRAQVLTLREEAQSLRQLLLHHKRASETIDICTI
ncbi:hypothetical protein GE061_007220 [Apolygus lucorum]|uniref:BZIP domain-containing protein n=1 Tax=Apolygus lucorum TaxID=248454 RepID=A0A8S9WV11_APOLU|nr:hypothetical protein GE061_007220 [Apolygus lucorum]